MSESNTPNSPGPGLDEAFVALAKYDTGSSRAGLVPIDDAVRASLKDLTRQATLEQRLLAQLARPASSEAGTYICDKLRLVGSAAAVPALAALLTDAALGDPARETLETLTSPAAGNALRRALPQLRSAARIGAVHALGHRGDPENADALAPLSTDSDPALAAAAIAALGNLGTLLAAKTLSRLLPNPPTELRLPIAHACLDCASALLKEGNKAEAAALYRELASKGWPELIVQAARHALQKVETHSG